MTPSERCLKTMRILIAEPRGYSRTALALLQEVAQVDELGLGREALLEQIDEYDALVVRLGFAVDRQVLEAGSRLRYLVTATTGLDHVDLACAEERGVRVLSLENETEFLREVRATAELTVALALAALRHLPEAAQSVREGRWDRDAFRGRELYGRVAGIVGVGRLGSMVAEYLRAMGMRVLGYDPRPDFPHDLAERVESLQKLLGRADLVTLHVSYGPDTHHLIGEAEFAAMKAGAVLVNTARGGVVDEGALLAALQEGRLSAAALDVVQGEPHVDQDHPLVSYARANPALLIVPHIGGATADSMEKTEVFMAEKLAAAIRSEQN